MAKRFWPGFQWRILAHKRTAPGRKGAYLPDHVVEMCSSDFSESVEFDELVIDHWFHLEQMDDRDWWIGIGNDIDGEGDYYHVNVHIDASKNARIEVEKHP